MDIIKFTDGVSYDTVFAKRGDVFMTYDVFKSPNQSPREDKILTKENRPVLIISNNKDNSELVRVLAFSSHRGNSSANSITNKRLIELPRLYNEGNDPNGKSYIDISQVFTINTYQLGRKIAHLSDEITDTAVALFTIHNIQSEKGARTLLKYLSDQYPNINTNTSTTNKVTSDPSEDYFVVVEETKETPNTTTTDSNGKHIYPPSSTVEECEKLYHEWVELSTDGFRYKYKLNKTQYNYLKNKCIKILIDKKAGFSKFDWKG